MSWFVGLEFRCQLFLKFFLFGFGRFLLFERVQFFFQIINLLFLFTLDTFEFILHFL